MIAERGGGEGVLAPLNKLINIRASFTMQCVISYFMVSACISSTPAI